MRRIVTTMKMPLRKGLFLSFVISGLAGCAVSPLQDPAKLNATIGVSSVALIQQFGVPSRSYQAQDHLFLAYIQSDTEYTPGTPDWGWGWGGGYGYGYGYGWGGGGGFPPSVYTTSCQTTFELVDDKVIGWKKRGDGC